MKKFIALVLSLVMALSLCAPAWAAEAPSDLEGKGTAESPYLVDTADELAAAIEKGGTVELLGDIILAAPVAVTKGTVLDLKGFGITATDTTSGVPIYVTSGKLTVRNGELALDGKETTIHGTYNCAIGYEPGTELVVDKVTFTGVTGINGTWKADGAVKISVSNSTFAVSSVGVVVAAGSKEAVATITNCTIDADRYAIFGSQGAQITVNGGNYTSNVAIYSQDAGTVVTVEGGTFTGALSESNNGKIVIKGGTFSVNPTQYVPDEGWYTVTESGSTWTVTKKDPVAKIGEVEYKDLQEAIDAAAGKTVTLLDNVTVDKTLVLNNVTLDGAGHTLTSTVSQKSLDDSIRGDGNAKMSAIFSEVGCTIKDLTIVGGWKGVCIDKTATVDTLLENVTILNSARGINFNDVESNAKLTVKDSTLSGWSGVEGNGVIAFENTTFKKNNSTRGSGLDPYGAITLTNCTFETGTVLSAEDIPADKAIAISNGTYNGELKVVDGKGTFSITGGTFADDPTPYVANGYAAFKSGEKYTVKAVVAKIGDVPYDTLQAAVTAVKNGETINVLVDKQTATVNEAKSFTVTGAAATITAGEGYKVLQDGNTYTVKKTYNVTFDANGGTNEYTLAPVVEGKLVLPANPFKAPEGKQFKAWSVGGKEYAVGAEIDVAADVTVVAVWEYLPAVTDDPEVDVIDPVVSTGDKVNTNDATVNNVVTTITSGVDIDHGAITEAAEEAAEENKVAPTKEQAKELNKLPGISGTTVNDVAIVVQTYYDVAIEEVKVENNKTSSITVDITPMQQTVATTDDVIENKDDIKVGENAVKVGDPVPVKITEPVEITLKLPSSCFEVGQKVYITHKASAGTVIYEATVAADYTITFKTTHGFSPFTISTTAADVKASVGTDNYADLQSAVNYMGKDATVTVKAKDQSAVVDFATTFTVKYENGATKDNTKITAAPGYYLTMKDVADGVQYTVSRAYGWGGGYVGGSSSTTPEKVVTSADTFDAGIALYVGMSVMAAAGSAVVLKKRED